MFLADKYNVTSNRKNKMLLLADKYNVSSNRSIQCCF